MKRSTCELTWKLSATKQREGGGHGLETCWELITVPYHELHRHMHGYRKENAREEDSEKHGVAQWGKSECWSWVEPGLAASDSVSWRSKIYGPNLHTEKQNWWSNIKFRSGVLKLLAEIHNFSKIKRKDCEILFIEKEPNEISRPKLQSNWISLI